MVVMVTHKASEINLGGQVIVIKNGVIEPAFDTSGHTFAPPNT